MKLALALLVVLVLSCSLCLADPPKWGFNFTDCLREYKSEGCFKDHSAPNRALADLGDNLRPVIDWKKWPDSMHRLACRCAWRAKQEGHKYFGLQFWGECWTGDGMPAESSPPKRCEGHNGYTGTRRCEAGNEWECVGKHWANFVYSVGNGIAPKPCTKNLNIGIVVQRSTLGIINERKITRFYKNFLKMFTEDHKIGVVAHASKSERRYTFSETDQDKMIKALDQWSDPDAEKLRDTWKDASLKEKNGQGSREETKAAYRAWSTAIRSGLENAILIAGQLFTEANPSYSNVIVVLTRVNWLKNKNLPGVVVNGKIVPIVVVGVGREQSRIFLQIEGGTLERVPSFNFLLGRIGEITEQTCDAV